MIKLIIMLIFMILSLSLKGQFPFENYPAMSYKKYSDWETYDKSKNEKKYHHTLTIPSFYNSLDTITIQLTSFINNWDSSFIRIYKNNNQIQKFFEPMGFSPSNMSEPVRVADINGDGLSDIKLIISYNGTGVACMNVRVIYLFQRNDGKFTKISFDDMLDENGRPERDFDGDNNFEIITMNLTYYGNHSYWLYNIYDYYSYQLINVNKKYDYPIMIQFLTRENFEITTKLSREKMKEFSKVLPDNYEKK